MPTICHLFDGIACWEQRVAVGQLLDRLPRDRYRQVLATIDPGAVIELGRLNRPIHSLPQMAGIRPLLASQVARFVARNRVDVVQAWGPEAAVAAASADCPVVLELFDPRIAARSARLLRTIARPNGFTVIASAEWVRRRLIEGGLPPAQITVIRPGVDFGLINSARKASLRSELGVADDQLVIIVPEPATRAGGQMDAFWSAALLNHLRRDVRIIVPGESAEAHRIAQFAATLPTRDALIATGRRYAFEELLPHADVLVVAAEGDASTTAIAWAMSAKVAVIGSAVHSITELLAHKVGGLLFKRHGGFAMNQNRDRKRAAPASLLPAKDRQGGLMSRLAPALIHACLPAECCAADRFNPVPLVKLLADREAQAKVREAAHGMAYESFGLRRYIDEHVTVYDSFSSGAGQGPLGAPKQATAPWSLPDSPGRSTGLLRP